MKKFIYFCIRPIFGIRDAYFSLPAYRGRMDGMHEVTETYEIGVFLFGTLYQFSILPGFVFDGASIPRLLWFAAGDPMQPPRVAAALVHDWLYRTGILPKWKADLLYGVIQAMAGRAYWRIIVEYLALVFGGGKAWLDNRASGQQEAALKLGRVIII